MEPFNDVYADEIVHTVSPDLHSNSKSCLLITRTNEGVPLSLNRRICWYRVATSAKGSEGVMECTSKNPSATRLCDNRAAALANRTSGR